ncbi:Septin-type G domain-containing protein [Mycena sanguinolenta]|uniref:Septin-type G domain-containing protein n=1 Tax=Mycena sanguinolenta TaxID=230812 RepID=A0A8H6ZCS1_9AGAR|nr:Septin-type G domain-containing protein [Mycena sanguinolenta]
MTVQGSTPVARKKIAGHVGFSNLPNQIRRKSVKDGFQLTVMVVGESGLGKTTLVNTLFNSQICAPREVPHPAADRPTTVAIENIQADIEENGVRLRLTVVDTPGFGDFVNNSTSWNPILESIEQRYEAYLQQEHRVRRTKLVDNRIHACVYFIQPTGHSLKQIDIEFMRRLHHRVNLIPVIAKADTMSEEEILDFKERILSDLAFHGIQIFQAPVYEDEDEESIQEAEEIARAIPFAIVGSENFVRTRDGRMVRGRAYPWGVVEVDNPEHSDFGLLRKLLVRTNMEELREHTNNVLFEAWRTERLLAMGFTQDPSVFQEVSPADELHQQRELHEAKLAKMEAAMKEVFREKVEIQEQKLKQSEVELYARHKEIKDALDKQREDLLRKRAQLEAGGSPDASRKKPFNFRG